MKHSNIALLQAISLAGNQTELAKILGIPPSQISAWLHNPNISMPIKYGDLIETWSDNQISKHNIFPDLHNVPIVKRKISTLEQIESLLHMAKSQNLDILLTVSLSEKEIINDDNFQTIQSTH